MAIEIPPGLLAFAGRGERWARWLDALPRLVADVMSDWELSYDGPPRHGFCALVQPVRTSDGAARVVKFSWPHDEQEHEHLALQAWHGDGAVRLFRAAPARDVMLLERLHERDLATVDDVHACEVIAALYSRLHKPALPQLRTLSSYITRWTADLQRLPSSAPIPRRLAEQAMSLGRAFGTDEGTDGTMVHTDLHYENVLAGDREPWLAIDPKPMSGDPHYEVAPLLWNRWDEVVDSGDVRGSVRTRFHTVIDAAMLDEQRARDWVVLRMVHNALWCIEDHPDGLDAEDEDYLTMCVTVAKAVQN